MHIKIEIQSIFFHIFRTQPSNLEIFFRDHEVTTLMRTEMYTTTNFIANCGGLLGLFLGISMLSIIEFIYYSTLRLYWSLRRWKSKNKVVPFERKTVINSISIDIPSNGNNSDSNVNSGFIDKNSLQTKHAN